MPYILCKLIKVTYGVYNKVQKFLPMLLKKITLLVSSLALLSCVSVNQDVVQRDFNTQLYSGNFKNAAQVALKNSGFDQKTSRTNNLVWSLQSGAALNYAQDYRQSTQLLDAAERLIKIENSEGGVANAGQMVGSLVLNDAALDYEPKYYDSVMVNTFKAWNSIFTGDHRLAKVELNRAKERQRRAVEYFAELIVERREAIREEAGRSSANVNRTMSSNQTKASLARAGIKQGVWKPYEGYVNPFTTYSYALHRMLTGTSKSDYQKAVDSFERVYAITGNKTAQADLQLAKTLARGASRSDIEGRIWVIYESGSAVMREEVIVDIPMFLTSHNISYTGIALPRLVKGARGVARIKVNGVSTTLLADMDKVIGAEFEHEFKFILAREISRAIIKTVTQKQLKDNSRLGGDVFALMQMLTTKADTRSFSALPSQYQVARLKTKAKVLTVQAGTFSERVSLEGQANNHIIYVKQVSANSKPTIRVINI